MTEDIWQSTDLSLLNIMKVSVNELVPHAHKKGLGSSYESFKLISDYHPLSCVWPSCRILYFGELMFVRVDLVESVEM